MPENIHPMRDPDDELLDIPECCRRIDLPSRAPVVTPNGLTEAEGLRHPRLGEPVAVYTYRDEAGNPIAHICRFETIDGERKKEYRPYSHQANGQWKWKGVPEPRPLYNLDRLRANPKAPVIVVEGEKAADALQSVLPDFVVTTAMHGAQSPHKADWRPLEGRDATLWPDADEAGIGYVNGVADCLQGIGANSVRIVPVYVYRDIYRLPDPDRADNVSYIERGKGWDAADAVAEGWDALRIRKLIGCAVPAPTYTYRLGNDGRRAEVDPAPTRDREPTPPIGSAEPADDWPEPDMSLLNPQSDRPFFPYETLGPSWGQWIRETAESVSAPVDYVAGTAISVAGALIGNSRWVSPWQDWEEPPVLWSALVGTPSAGKSPAMGPVLKIVSQLERDALPQYDATMRDFETRTLAAKFARERWERDAQEAEKRNMPLPLMPESAEKPLKPERPRLVVSDVTMEAMGSLLAAQPRGILTYRDELAGWLGNFDRYGGRGGDRAFWLEAYGGRPYVMERVKFEGKPVCIPHLSISVLGGIQPDRLQSMLMRGDDDGLTARFLWYWPERVPPRRPEVMVNRAAMHRALERLSRLSSLGATQDCVLDPSVIPLSLEASDLFQDWREVHADAEPAGTFAGWWGKCPGTVLRLALILQFLWWSGADDYTEPDQIGSEAIAAAIRLVDGYFKPMAQLAYGERTLTEGNRKAVALGRALLDRQAATFNVREIYKLWGVSGLTDAESVQAAVLYLVKSGWLRRAPGPSNRVGGRPRLEYAVNPGLLQN